jgi:hypothetical protein
MANITIETPDSISYKLGRNAEYGTITVELERLPQVALFYLFDYGLRQVLNDSIATKEDKNGNKLDVAAKAHAKLDALYDGSIRTRGEAITSDPYEAEAFKEMKRHLVAVLTKSGLMRDIPKGTQDRFMFVVNRMQAKAGKPETTEREYLLDRLATPAGVKIAEAARKTVDERRALEDDVEGLI